MNGGWEPLLCPAILKASGQVEVMIKGLSCAGSQIHGSLTLRAAFGSGRTAWGSPSAPPFLDKGARLIHLPAGDAGWGFHRLGRLVVRGGPTGHLQKAEGRAGSVSGGRPRPRQPRAVPEAKGSLRSLGSGAESLAKKS